jgi:hypothetical protein
MSKNSSIEQRNPAVWATCCNCGGWVHRSPFYRDDEQHHNDLADCVQYLASELRRLQKPE